MSDSKASMVKAFALWINEGPKGKYFSGSFGDLKVMIFKNGYKSGEKDPDYIAYFAQREQKQTGGGGKSGGAPSRGNRSLEITDDDVPF